MGEHDIFIDQILVIVREGPCLPNGLVPCNDDLTDEVRDWMLAHGWSELDWCLHMAFGAGTTVCWVSFQDPDKAMLFKLAWGGSLG